MGTSTNGQINFGIPFDEGYEFPWGYEEYEGDWEAWWLYEVCKYEPEFEIFDADGGYIGGVKPSRDVISEYFRHERDFLKNHPLPVNIINYCSGDCPMYMVAIKSKSFSNSRGYPEVFDPATLTVTEEEKESLVDFCKKYCMGGEYDEPPEFTPKWYLSSYLG